MDFVAFEAHAHATFILDQLNTYVVTHGAGGGQLQIIHNILYPKLYNIPREIQQTNGILVLENFRLHGIGTQQQYITCYMLCACLIVGFGVSTVSTSMMIKSHNQIIQEFLYISWIKFHLNTSHNKATCSYPLRVTPTTSLGSDRHHFGTFV